MFHLIQVDACRFEFQTLHGMHCAPIKLHGDKYKHKSIRIPKIKKTEKFKSKTFEIQEPIK